MNQVHFFRLNIEADNTQDGKTTSHFLNVLATWRGSTYSDNKPIVTVQLLTESLDYFVIKNFGKAYLAAEKIAQVHFAELARQERINKARAELIAAGEIIENPVLARYEPGTAITLTDDLPY